MLTNVYFALNEDTWVGVVESSENIIDMSTFAQRVYRASQWNQEKREEIQAFDMLDRWTLKCELTWFSGLFCCRLQWGWRYMSLSDVI